MDKRTTATAMTAGDIVRYANPEAGESALTFTVIERRGDRVLLASRDFQGVRITPQEVVTITDVVLIGRS